MQTEELTKKPGYLNPVSRDPTSLPVDSDLDLPEGPFCVNLDGTLTRTNLLWESAFLLLREKPWMIPSLVLWIVQGKSTLERHLAEFTNLKPSLLPYNGKLVNWLHQARKNGREIVLVSNCNVSLAESIANHLDLFDDLIVYKSSPAAEIQRRYGHGFTFIGDGTEDSEIWQRCHAAVLVDPSSKAETTARKAVPITQIFRTAKNRAKLLVRALRVHQWVKNLLIFVPLISSHQIGNFRLLFLAILGFFSFSFCASGIYLINDILDIESDRQHSRKRNRPFASGELPLQYGIALLPILLGLSFFLATRTSGQFVGVLSVYLGLTFLYSFSLKRKLLVDVFALATLYTLRIVAGSAAYAIPLSSWLLAFSVFFFLSLGFCKRAAEMKNLSKDGKTETAGRAYFLSDLPQVNLFGVASGFISSLVLALYMDSNNMRALYRNQDFLWLSCPLMLYWLTRIWLLTSRGEMNEDPIVFAAKDRVTYAIGFLVLGLIILATYLGRS